MTETRHAVSSTWMHIHFKGSRAFTETYGFAGNQGSVNLEAVLLRPEGVPSKTLMVFMHPASTLQLLPVPNEMAALGVHVLCAASRYAKNDSALIMENVIVDLGAHIRHAKEKLGYERVVLAGWSGGGSLSLFYQSQAERPTIEQTPAGDPVDIRGAGLIPADAVVCQAAHLSRAVMLRDMIDPSVVDELDPDAPRTLELDIYHPANPNQPPYSADYVAHYRTAQLARVRRITQRVQETLDHLRKKGTGEVEHGFVTHRTLADPRYLDTALEPNGRRARWCYLGNPETVNTGPVGLARFSMLRSWLSQWSIDHSRADGLQCAAQISVPFLAIENAADDCVPQQHARLLHDACASQDKTMKVIHGATHYYAGQPELLTESTLLIKDWLRSRKLLSD
ncbi:Alpha/beta hydrolase family protein [Variovorax sp. PBS-H4]|uniref:alpha/beta hydrolase family protein n=1 Tax=Variovorax sp. PBS-H4 TaxID=434008 RepID=UPI001316F3CB|nr:alpha/beta hydrolase [Variovorax sp. PBS-H4]VTU37522.1 Alpha/beta hydrolase family protein [Variovorax sp. PBS-H4]